MVWYIVFIRVINVNIFKYNLFIIKSKPMLSNGDTESRDVDFIRRSVGIFSWSKLEKIYR